MSPASTPPPPANSFASDNAAGVAPEALDALGRANHGTALAYGDDPWTRQAEGAVDDLFGRHVETFLCWGGTGANVVGLASVLQPHQCILTVGTAHIVVDECGAPVRFTGSTLQTVPHQDGKLVPGSLDPFVHWLGSEHHPQPAVVSISQATEMGTCYETEEIAAICDAAHAHGMLVHLDGARIANAVVASGGSLSSMVTDTGVDVMTLGMTKNGAMYGEAVIFAVHDLAKDFEVWRKGSLQLGSKTRFISAQLEALLTNGLWRDLADNANRCARALADAIEWIDGVEVVQEVQANIVFILMKLDHAHDFLDRRRPQVPLLFPMGDHGLIRLVASWNSEMDDVDRLVSDLTVATGAHVH